MAIHTLCTPAGFTQQPSLSLGGFGTSGQAQAEGRLLVPALKEENRAVGAGIYAPKSSRGSRSRPE